MADNDNEHFSLAMKCERKRRYKTLMKKKNRKKEEKSINK